jgi:sulfite dehydrogenase (cytochrome) subunit B
MKRHLRQARLSAAIFTAFLIAAPAGYHSGHAAPETYQLPEETARLAAAPDAGLAEANCVVCHSLDYITMQPRAKGKAFWDAEVTKMIKVFGAPLAPGDAEAIANYLTAHY